MTNSLGREAANQEEPGTSKSDIALKMLSNDGRTNVGNLIRNTHAIAENGRPRTDFVWMAKLDEKKGPDVGNTYRRDKSRREFVDIIAQVEETKLSEAINPPALNPAFPRRDPRAQPGFSPPPYVPMDKPTVNTHSGDAIWRIGLTLSSLHAPVE